MIEIAFRNLVSHLTKASFSSNADRQSALNCVEALDEHIAAQEKRIAELEAMNTAQAGQEIADIRVAFESWAKQEFSEYFEDDGESMFDRAKSNDYNNLLLRNALGPFQAGAAWQSSQSILPAPADAIDAIAIVNACADECERTMMFPGGRCESFAHHGVVNAATALRDNAQAIIATAMKAAK